MKVVRLMGSALTKNLNGKRVIITGGSSGIGRAAAIAFAGVGAHVLINHFSDAAGAECTVAEIKKGVSTAHCAVIDADVGAPEGVRAIFDACERELGGVDILVNNAGIKIEQDPLQYSAEDFDRIIAVNLRGSLLAAQAAIRHFREHGIEGAIVNTSSIHEASPVTWDIGYAISKSGLSMMTKVLALAFAKDKIRINSVGPGATNTPMNAATWRDHPESLSQTIDSIPLGRVASPDEIAKSILFLASGDSAYTTGQTLYVDGGLML